MITNLITWAGVVILATDPVYVSTRLLFKMKSVEVEVEPNGNHIVLLPVALTWRDCQWYPCVMPLNPE